MLTGCDAQILPEPGVAAQQLGQLFLVLSDKRWCWCLNPSHQPKPLITLVLSYAPSPLQSLLNLWQLEATWRILMPLAHVQIYVSVLLVMLRSVANAVPGW